MKRILSIALALLLALGCFSAFAEEAPLTIRVMTTAHPTMPISADWLTFKTLEDKFNVRFEFELVPEADYDEKLQTILAGGDIPDVFFAKTSIMAQYYDLGVVLQLDDLLAEYAPNLLAQWDSHELNRNVKSDDGHYYYTTYIDESSGLECCGWMNVDMMTECGIEAVPASYEELEADLKLFREHYGADSGCIPMACGPWYTVERPIYYAFKTFDDWIYYNDEDGYVYGPYYYADNMKAAVSYMHGLFADGLLDSEYLTRDADSINALAAEGKIGYFVTWADHAAAIAEGGSYGCNYIPVPALQATIDVEKHVGHKSATGTPMFISAGASEEVVRRWLEIVNYIYSDEGILLMDWGVEGDTYEMVDGKPQLTEKVLGSELGELNGRRSFGMEPQAFPHLASWDGWSAVLWDVTVDVTNANAPFVLPQQPNLTGSFDEDSELAQIMGDITNYVKTNLTQFVVGEKDIEAEWDGFVAQLKAMGIERASEIQAAKFERWLNR